MRGVLQYHFVWEREMSKKTLESILGIDDNFFEENYKPSPCRQISIDKELNLIVLKLDGVELYKQEIPKLGRDINMEFINFILQAWRFGNTTIIQNELKMGEIK